MNNIQNLKPNYPQIVNLSQEKNFAQRQSFKGMTANEFDVYKTAIDELAGNFKPVGKTLRWIANFLNEHDGEIQSQSINAFFTTTLAPLMIAYNPFSNSDQKTKEYSALRQPISAGIAISGGLAMTQIINSFMSRLSNEGHIAITDGRINPDKSYLAKFYNEAYKTSKNKEEFLKGYEPEIFEGQRFKENGEPTKKYKKACLDKYVEVIQKERKELFSALIGENPSNISIDKNGTISVVHTKTKAEIEDEIKNLATEGKIVTAENIAKIETKKYNNIPNLENETQLEKYLNEHSIHRNTLAKFMKENFGFEFYDAEKGNLPEVKPSSVQNRLKETKAMDFLKKLGIIGKETELEGKEKVNGKDLGKLLLGKDEDISKLSLEELLEKLNIIKQTDKTKSVQEILNAKTKDLQGLMDQNISEVLKRFETLIDKNTIHNFKPQAKILDFARNITAERINNVGKHFKAINNYTGIFFNLFTTAITCTVLNWAYPRIVERLFPHLVKNDSPEQHTAKKGGNK